MLQQQSKSKINLLLIKLLAFFIVLTPRLPISSSHAIRMEQVLVIGICFYAMVRFLIFRKLTIHISLFPVMFILFSMFILYSIFNGYFHGYRIVLNDFFELYKIIIYIGTFLITATLINDQEDKVEILKFLNILIWISGLIAITQYFNVLGLNEKYVKIIAPTQYLTLVDGYKNPRVISLSDNPNVYAVIVAIGALISLGLFFYEKKKYNIIIFGIDYIALLMTRSRTGFILSVVSIFIFFILGLREYTRKKSIGIGGRIKLMFGIGIFGVAFMALVFFVAPDALTWRLKEILDISSSRSWQLRLANWSEHFNYFLGCPILGMGPVKAIKYQYNADNEWLILLKKYGIVGTIYFINMFFIPVLAHWRKLTNNLIGKIYISTLVGAILYMVPAALFHSFQLMALIMILAGMSFSSSNSLRKIKF